MRCEHTLASSAALGIIKNDHMGCYLQELRARIIDRCQRCPIGDLLSWSMLVEEEEPGQSLFYSYLNYLCSSASYPGFLRVNIQDSKVTGSLISCLRMLQMKVGFYFFSSFCCNSISIKNQPMFHDIADYSCFSFFYLQYPVG